MVEDVEVSLALLLVHHSALLQKIAFDRSSADVIAIAEMHLDPLSKARRVVVSHGLGVSEGFQNGIGLQNFLLQRRIRSGDLHFTVSLLPPYLCDEAQTLLGRFRFASSRLAGNQDRLVGSIHRHFLKGRIGDVVHMGRQ